MSKNILILGAGAIGSCVAANFSQANIRHLIVDPWPDLITKVQEHGLQITMPDHEIRTPPLKAIHLHELASSSELFDIIFLACKANEARWLTEFIKPFMHSQSVIVGLMNGMMNQDIASIVGSERLIGCVLELSAESFEAGHITRKTPPAKTWMCVGELNGQITPRLLEIQGLLQHVATVDLSKNIEAAKWTKLITNVMVLAPFAMLKADSYAALQLPKMRQLVLDLGIEAIAVGQALGYPVEGIFGLTVEELGKTPKQISEKLVSTLISHIGKKSQNAVTQDIIKKRRTETSFLNGLVVCQGLACHIPTPANRAIVEVIRRIELQEIAAGMENIDLAISLTM